MKDTRYAFCVAKIRALENKMLTKQDISSLINSQDLTSAFVFLKESGYAKDGETVASLIKRQGDELDKLLFEIVPDTKELENLYILNDYFNIKVLVKCAVDKADAEALLTYPTTISAESFISKAAMGDFSFLKDDYRVVAQNAYNIALKSENGKFCDVIIDKAAIDALAAYADKKHSSMLGEIYAFVADLSNIKTALRCSYTNQNSDYINAAIGNCSRIDKSDLLSATAEGYDRLVSYLMTTCYNDAVKVYIENPSNFEKWYDDKIIDIASASIYTSFGFAPVVSYFYRKNLEIKTVRMILSAIKSDIDKDKIRERVRKLYA